MTFNKLDEYIKRKTLVDRRDIKAWHCIRYTVSDKPFAIISFSAQKRPIITLRCLACDIDNLRKKYPKVVVAAKLQDPLKWNSIFLDAQMPEKDFLELIDDSYHIVEADIPALEAAENGDGARRYTDVKNAFNFTKILKPRNIVFRKDIDLDAIYRDAFLDIPTKDE